MTTESLNSFTTINQTNHGQKGVGEEVFLNNVHYCFFFLMFLEQFKRLNFLLKNIGRI